MNPDEINEPPANAVMTYMNMVSMSALSLLTRANKNLVEGKNITSIKQIDTGLARWMNN